jgi:hypothetical protein
LVYVNGIGIVTLFPGWVTVLVYVNGIGIVTLFPGWVTVWRSQWIAPKVHLFAGPLVIRSHATNASIKPPESMNSYLVSWLQPIDGCTQESKAHGRLITYWPLPENAQNTPEIVEMWLHTVVSVQVDTDVAVEVAVVVLHSVHVDTEVDTEVDVTVQVSVVLLMMVSFLQVEDLGLPYPPVGYSS